MTEIINLNNTTPAAPAGMANVSWQKGAQSGTDPESGYPIFPISANYQNVGGVEVKTANYTVVAEDVSKLLSFNSASAVTLTLPAAAPNATWNVLVENIGAGVLTVSPNGLRLDGVTGSLVLQQNQGVYISTDGTNYFTERGAAPIATYSTPGIVKPDGTTITIDGTGKIVASGGGGGGYVPSNLPLPPPLTAFTWMNQGPATATNKGNSILLANPDTGVLNWRLLTKNSPANPPWSVAAFLRSFQFALTSQAIGLYLTDGTKLIGLEVLSQNGAMVLRVEIMNSVTSDQSMLMSAANILGGPQHGGWYLRWRNDGTNLYADVSLDGDNWWNFYTMAVTSWLTPIAYGFGSATIVSTAYYIYTSLQGWLETASAAL